MVIKISNTKSFQHIGRNLWYVGRKNKETEEHFITYNREGQVIHKDWFPQLRKDLQQYDLYYRVILSPDPALWLDCDALHLMTQKAITEIEKQSKAELVGCYAIHTDTNVLHSHIVLGGFQEQLKMSKREFIRAKENIVKLENELYLQKKEQEQVR